MCTQLHMLRIYIYIYYWLCCNYFYIWFEVWFPFRDRVCILCWTGRPIHPYHKGEKVELPRAARVTMYFSVNCLGYDKLTSERLSCPNVLSLPESSLRLLTFPILLFDFSFQKRRIPSLLSSVLLSQFWNWGNEQVGSVDNSGLPFAWWTVNTQVRHAFICALAWVVVRTVIFMLHNFDTNAVIVYSFRPYLFSIIHLNYRKSKSGVMLTKSLKWQKKLEGQLCAILYSFMHFL